MSKMWGGRFAGGFDEAAAQLNNSLSFDARLWPEDVAGSIAHATMLGETGVLPSAEASAIVEALHGIESDLAAGVVGLDPGAEDVHTAVEMLLRARIGPLAGKLHTARSRNDQVATDTRLYLRGQLDAILAEVRRMQLVLLARAEGSIDVVLPGFTHLQHAQPVLLAHHLLAYFWMLERDAERVTDARRRINRLPLGAGALAGVPFPIDRRRVAELLGFEDVLPNSMDAVADRDFVAEFLACAVILMTHLSRLAEELIVWSSPEFGYVELDDSVTTGSSIMPQKKNPDIAELTRGKVGRVLGGLVGIVTTMKGLPLAYNKDLQEDKEPLFDAVDTLRAVIPALRRTVETASFRPERMEGALRRDYSTATDLADALVRSGMPFRDAHELVGGIVRSCIDRGIGLEDLGAEELAAFSPALAAVDASPRASIGARTSEGGTAPQAVRAQLARARQALADFAG
ncbi:MAG TPA: argininosuccinate lyase [Chthonomonadales bacterium]|nr:argininosuccinate lyase [Chthonomonadales bacterium]